MKNCNNCEKRFKNENKKGCQVFKEKPNNCWAWTNDPKWLEKVNEDVKNYKMIHADE